MKFTGEGMTAHDHTFGLVNVEKPHNEKPIAKFDLDRLKKAIEVAQTLGHDEMYLWDVPSLPDDDDDRCLAFTAGKDDDIGIAVAPRVKIE